MYKNDGVHGSDMTIADAFEYVVNVKVEEHVSDYSIKGYRDHLLAFRRYLVEIGIVLLNDVTGAYFRQFIQSERKRGLSQTSLNNHIKYVRAGFNILIRDEFYLKDENPGNFVKQGKPAESSYFPIPAYLVPMVLKQPDQRSFLGKRNYLIMLTILDCGIRPSELLKGEVSDWAGNYYTVRASVAKTKEARVLPLSMETQKQFQQYLRMKGDWGGETLFPNQFGESFNTDGFRRALRKICKRAGLDKAETKLVHPYAFRHTFAYNYVEAGGNVFKLQEILGHTDIAMTKRYVKLIGRDLLDAHKKVQPLSKYVKSPKKRRRV